MTRLTDEQIAAFLETAQRRHEIVGGDSNSPLWGFFEILELALYEVQERRQKERLDGVPEEFVEVAAGKPRS